MSVSSVELCTDAETAACSPLPLVDWMVVSLAVCGGATPLDVVSGAVGFTDKYCSVSCEGENIC